MARQILGLAHADWSQSGTSRRIGRDSPGRRIANSYICRPGQVDPRRFGTAYLSQSWRRGCLGCWFQRPPPEPVAFFVSQIFGAARLSLSQSGTRERIGWDGSRTVPPLRLRSSPGSSCDRYAWARPSLGQAGALAVMAPISRPPPSSSSGPGQEVPRRYGTPCTVPVWGWLTCSAVTSPYCKLSIACWFLKVGIP